MPSPSTPRAFDAASRVVASAALFCLACRLVVLFWANHVYDDAFISWRVARHLAEGEGPVFNLGERVQASTSLPHVFLCALWWKIAGPLGITLDRLVACAVDAITVATVARGLLEIRSLPREAAYWGCAAFSVYYGLASESALVVPSGLETALFNGAVTQALFALARGRETALGAWTAACVMLRPDGAIVALLLLLDACVRKRARAVLLCLTLLAPFLLLQTYYFGSPIPQSMVAKGLIQHSPWRSWTTLVRTFAWGRAQPLIAAMAFVGAGFGWRIPFVRTMALWGALQGAALATFTSFWAWYWAPLNLAFACLFGHGVAHTYAALRASFAASAVRGVTAIAMLALCAELGYVLRADIDYVGRHRRASAAQDVRIAAYLEAETAPESHVLVERLGVLAFHAARRFDDYPGLASPAVTTALSRLGRQVGFGPGDSEALRAVLADVQPSYAVLRQYEYEAALSAGALHAYRVVQVFPIEKDGLPFAPEHTQMFLVKRDASLR